MEEAREYEHLEIKEVGISVLLLSGVRDSSQLETAEDIQETELADIHAEAQLPSTALHRPSSVSHHANAARHARQAQPQGHEATYSPCCRPYSHSVRSCDLVAKLLKFKLN